MPRDKEKSHERLNDAAKGEFLKKGFNNASMREIGRLAGMSQAAIYKHYLNKEEMFSSIVEPGIKAILDLCSNHEKRAYEDFDNDRDPNAMLKNNTTKIIKEIILNYRDEFKLILCCSQGTRYETFITDMVKEEEKGTRVALDYIKSKGVKIRDVSDKELNMLLSAYLTACFEPIRKDWSVSEALNGLDLIEEFFIPGFRKIFGM